MALVDLTISGHMEESYVSIAEADAYLLFDPTLSDDWESLQPEDKMRRLVGARRRLDRLNWRGEKTMATRSLQSGPARPCSTLTARTFRRM